MEFTRSGPDVALRRPRRAQWLVVWCVAAVVLAASAFAAGLFIKSPWEDAVANADAQLTTAADVTEREFFAEVVRAEGHIELGRDIHVPVPAMSAARSIVTEGGVSASHQVVYGQPLIEVSGRPVFVLDLKIPMYRDLAPGMQGPDVESVQQALADAGFYIGRADGDYGAGTAAAVRAMYTAAGAEPPAIVPYAGWEAPVGTAQEDASADDEAHVDDASSQAGDADVEEPDSANEPPEDTPLPMAEVVDVPGGGALVVSIAALGADLAGSDDVALLRTGTPHVTARVGVASGDGFKPGDTAILSIPGADPIEVEVSSVSDFMPAGGDGSPPGYDIVADLRARDAKGVRDGDTVILEPADLAEGVRALAVPMTAVREDATGTYVLLTGNEAHRVNIEVGLQNDGFVQLVEPDGIEIGDGVLIGESDG